MTEGVDYNIDVKVSESNHEKCDHLYTVKVRNGERLINNRTKHVKKAVCI